NGCSTAPHSRVLVVVVARQPRPIADRPPPFRQIRASASAQAWCLSASTAFLSLLIVRAAADVGVRRRGSDGFGREADAIEPGFEDRADRGIADRIDGKRPLAGRFQPITLIAARQCDDAHGGAVTLLRMRPCPYIRSTRMAALGPIRAAPWIRLAGVMLA